MPARVGHRRQDTSVSSCVAVTVTPGSTAPDRQPAADDGAGVDLRERRGRGPQARHHGGEAKQAGEALARRRAPGDGRDPCGRDPRQNPVPRRLSSTSAAPLVPTPAREVWYYCRVSPSATASPTGVTLGRTLLRCALPLAAIALLTTWPWRFQDHAHRSTPGRGSRSPASCARATGSPTSACSYRSASPMPGAAPVGDWPGRRHWPGWRARWPPSWPQVYTHERAPTAADLLASYVGRVARCALGGGADAPIRHGAHGQAGRCRVRARPGRSRDRRRRPHARHAWRFPVPLDTCITCTQLCNKCCMADPTVPAAAAPLAGAALPGAEPLLERARAHLAAACSGSAPSRSGRRRYVLPNRDGPREDLEWLEARDRRARAARPPCSPPTATRPRFAHDDIVGRVPRGARARDVRRARTGARHRLLTRLARRHEGRRQR